MLNAEQLINAQMKASPLNSPPKAFVVPGANPWTKYVFLVAIISVALIGAYLITKPNKTNNYGTDKN